MRSGGRERQPSAMVANLIDADLLIIITDIDGLYTADPTANPDARLDRACRAPRCRDLQTGAGQQIRLGHGGHVHQIGCRRHRRAFRARRWSIANGGRENILAGVRAGSVPCIGSGAQSAPLKGQTLVVGAERHRWQGACGCRRGRALIGAARACCRWAWWMYWVISSGRHH